MIPARSIHPRATKAHKIRHMISNAKREEQLTEHVRVHAHNRTESTKAFAPRTARTDRSTIAASACHASSLRSWSTMFFDPSSSSISSANTSSNVAP